LIGMRGAQTERRNDRKKEGQTFQTPRPTPQYRGHKRAAQFLPGPVFASTPLLDGHVPFARGCCRVADPARSSTEPLPAGPESVDRLRHPLGQQLAELAWLRGASALGDECLAVEEFGHVAELL